MRPFLARDTLIHYPIYAAITGSFGYWMMGVEQRQMKLLKGRREALLEKRRRYAATTEGIDGVVPVVV